jgi:hypothetical protein
MAFSDFNSVISNKSTKENQIDAEFKARMYIISVFKKWLKLHKISKYLLLISMQYELLWGFQERKI